MLTFCKEIHNNPPHIYLIIMLKYRLYINYIKYIIMYILRNLYKYFQYKDNKSSSFTSSS